MGYVGQILGMVDESRSLLETLRHVSLLQKVIKGRFQGKNSPGRPRALLLNVLMSGADPGFLIRGPRRTPKARVSRSRAGGASILAPSAGCEGVGVC